MQLTGRRSFLLGAAALAATPLARAQQAGRNYRVAALLAGGKEAMQTYRRALTEQLATHGFVEGRNLAIEARGAVAIFHEDRELARELIAWRPDAIFTCLTSVTQAARAATRTLPIVFTWVGDPVGSGIVRHNAKPGGNATGVTNRTAELGAKRLELVRELLPEARRVGIIGVISPEDPINRAITEPLRKAATGFGITLLDIPLQGNWDGTFAAAGRGGAQALLPFYPFAAGGEFLSAEIVIEYTQRRKVPIVFTEAEIVERGGLMSYGSNLVDDVRRAADLLAAVLKGADPASLAVDQAARFELAINLRTARAMELAIPQPLVLRADRVIE
jgi:putative ABC transport system substrate-binding protein